jgi:hypothetical protein
MIAVEDCYNAIEPFQKQIAFAPFYYNGSSNI